MSRNSWWSYSYIEQNFSEQNNNGNKLKKNNVLAVKHQKSVETRNNNNISSIKERGCSENIISETVTDTTTAKDNKNGQTSNAIPIPTNQNSRHEEQKNKSTSSFISWWPTSSTSSTSPQKDIIINNNNKNNNNNYSIGEKQKTHSNSKSIRHEKQSLRQENDPSISATNENSKRYHEVGTDSRDNGRKKSSTSESNMEGSDKNSKLSSSNSSKGWWMFGGGNNASREDVSSNNAANNIMNKPEKVSKQSQIKDVDTVNKQMDQVSKQVSSDNKDSIMTTSPTISDVENSSSSESVRKVKKKSSETRRWSLFNTWSTSTPNLLESSSEGENSKIASDDDCASKPFTTNLESESLNSNNENGNSSNLNNKKKRPSRNSRRSTNPIVKSLPDHRSSWVHFFTNVHHAQSNRIDRRTNRRMIANGSASHSAEMKDTIKIATIAEVEKKTSVDSTSPPLKPALKPVPANIVLPTFEDFASNKPHRHPDSMLQRSLHAINSYFFPPDKSLEGTLPKWLDEITRSTVDVKRIAIIGVHGWFPASAKLVRAVVGEPTGTSPKFCDMMAKAILGYLSKHGIILPSDSITCIPLEGEGTTSTREELLHKNLMHNKTWCEALSLADVVFVATHSQGTPVSTILLSRLIKEGRIHPKRQRICMLAMAGVSHGPFPYLKENYIVKYYVGAGRSHDADAARELFDYMNSESLVSKKYREALKKIVQSGIKLVYVASMDDQVVPLYSGLFTGVDHPSIMRAIYIDGPLYQSNDFLTNLIVFAIRLRNAGILDNGLMVQLSEVVAGSMYGEGHSNLYNEIDVYTLAVRYLFETPLLDSYDVKHDRFQAQQKINPYYLPWAMRGILEDKRVLGSQSFKQDVLKLRKQYEEWEPASKSMKEVKYRLEPLREAIFGRTKL